MVSRFVRKVRTKSGAVAVQVVTRQGRQVLGIEHVGSAHTDEDLALLVAAARDRLLHGQAALDLGEVDAVPARMVDVADWTVPDAGLPPARARAGGRPGGRVVATSSLLLWRVLSDAYSHLGFDVLGDEAFRAMVLARIVEPTSKADSLRVLGEIGAPAPGLRTLFRSLKRCQDRDYRGLLATACTAHAAATGGLGALVMYDVTTLHFETGDEDTGPDALRKIRSQAREGVLIVDPWDCFGVAQVFAYGSEIAALSAST